MELLQFDHTCNHIHCVCMCFERDAVLVRLENIRFEAYVYVNAMMWKVVFAELRALTNSNAITESGLGLNPMELNALYEYLWNLGVLLKMDGCLSILQPEFRPWPIKYMKGTQLVPAIFYRRLEKNEELNNFHARGDVITLVLPPPDCLLHLQDCHT
jgi:hypothetical protein